LIWRLLSKHPDKSPKLEPLDTVRIFGRFDFEPDPEVLITGEVRAPGRLSHLQASNICAMRFFRPEALTPDAWLDSAQLFRRQPDGPLESLALT